MEVCQVLRRAISEMYIRGRASVTYVTCNDGLAAPSRHGLGFTRRGKIGNSRSRIPARWKARGRRVQCTDGPVCAKRNLHSVISILGSARVISRSLKVQMSRDRLPIVFNESQSHLSYIREVTLNSPLQMDD